jgi:site-specific DNA-methyltransferase (cytosine-N4-specific)
MVWWFSKSEWPKADNRTVLQPYSDSMKSLIKNGYKAKKRPSGHDISTKFQKDSGVSIVA